MEDHDLVYRSRSPYHLRQTWFVFAVAVAFFVLQLLAYAVGLAGSVFFTPFGFAAAAATAVGLMSVAASWNKRCCRACGDGLHDDRHVMVSRRALPEVSDALRQHDAPAIVAAVTDNPHRRGEKWKRLRLEYCARCKEVALVQLEREKAFFPEHLPPPHVFTGSDVTRLLEISEEDTD